MLATDLQPTRTETRLELLLRSLVRRHGGDLDAGQRALQEHFTEEEWGQVLYDWEWNRREGQDLPDGDWASLVVQAGRGWGKALALDTPLPTPTGWTTMGDVRPGDWLIDERGRPCSVTYATEVQLNRRCFRVRFDDGSEIVADGDHRWLTWTKQARKARGRSQRPRSGSLVRTTDEIRATLIVDHGERNHSIELAAPIDLADAILPVDPYVLGLWLGDGSSAGGDITISDRDAPELMALLRAAGEPVTGSAHRSGLSKASCATYRVGGLTRIRDAVTGRMTGNGSLTTRLRLLGLLGNKHVPISYLRSAEAQRLALMQGLMDSDGSAQAGGHVEFCTTKRVLADGAFELAVTLGMKPTLAEERARLNGRDCGPRFRVSWTTHQPVFRLARKAARLRQTVAQGNRTRHRYIVAVDPVDSVPVRCIQVDSPSHLFLAGRAMIPTHNTRFGAEAVRKWAEEGEPNPIYIIGPTGDDVRSVMVEGNESGIMAMSRPDFRPIYEPSKRRLIWPNGVIAYTRSGDRPDRLRGPQGSKAWVDELCAMRYADQVRDQLDLMIRLGDPRVVYTTTPRPTQVFREIIREPDTVVLRGTTLENRRHLSKKFMKRVYRKYEGTRLGRQELGGEILDDNPGALWKIAMIEKHRVVTAPPDLLQVVEGVDPAVTSDEKSAETGIVVVATAMCRCKGKNPERHAFVLADLSDIMTPDEWAKAVAKGYHDHRADRVVAEVNNGGDLVESNLRTLGDSDISYEAVHASRGKAIRAEPVSALYEQGKVHHVGAFAKLEDQMTQWNPLTDRKSPDRLDALVWALTHLMLGEIEGPSMWDVL